MCVCTRVCLFACYYKYVFVCLTFYMRLRKCALVARAHLKSECAVYSTSYGSHVRGQGERTLHEGGVKRHAHLSAHTHTHTLIALPSPERTG
jgi:hypothetical protein